MSLRILAVSLTENWLFEFKKYFVNLHYKVDMASSEEDAVRQLQNLKYFAIVINGDSKISSYKKLLINIKENQHLILFLLHKTFDNEKLKEDYFAKLKEYDITEVHTPPFDHTNIRFFLEGHQSVSELMSNVPKKSKVKSTNLRVDDDQFTQIKIMDLYQAGPILFDVYIKLEKNHYVKVFHAGDIFSNDYLTKYKEEKRIEYLYFKRSDLGKFVKLSNFVTGKIIENKKVKSSTKTKMMQNVASKYLERAFFEEITPLVFEQGIEVCKNIYKLIEREKNLHKIFKTYQNFDPDIYTHGFLVTMFSTAIIKQFSWQSKATIETAVLASLLHDIGMMKLPQDLRKLEPSLMTDKELEVYKGHPILGLELLSKNQLINHSMKQIILQHHEHFDGTGFPHGLKGADIYFLANIVCTADNFVNIITTKNKKPIAALEIILNDKELLSRYNPQIIENLIKIFIDPRKLKNKFTLPAEPKIIKKKAS